MILKNAKNLSLLKNVGKITVLVPQKKQLDDNSIDQ